MFTGFCHRIARHCTALVALVLLVGCTGTPEGIGPVKPFSLQPYLGQWYEIARLDHSFERGLSRVTATYQQRDDGGVSVLNRGYDNNEGQWQEAEGKAYFVESPDAGHLKVSFFGPFYSSYIVFELGEQNAKGQYPYAFVTGYNRDYLWFLAREPQVSDELKTEFIARAKALGFNTEELIWVEQSKKLVRR